MSEPMPCSGVVDPYDVVVPYSKWYVAEWPLGFAVPFRVALVCATLVAFPVVAVGGGHVGAVTRRPQTSNCLFTRPPWIVSPNQFAMKSHVWLLNATDGLKPARLVLLDDPMSEIGKSRVPVSAPDPVT